MNDKITIEPGQTLLVYNGNKILVKRIISERTFYVSAFQVFAGDAQAVEAKIAELGLS
jgi:hypothetical protein